MNNARRLLELQREVEREFARRELEARRDPDDPYQLMVESFADSVISGQPVAISPEESVANMKVIDQVREAAGF